VLWRCDDAIPTIRSDALQRRDVFARVLRGEVRAFTRDFLTPTPARVAERVDVRRPCGGAGAEASVTEGEQLCSNVVLQVNGFISTYRAQGLSVADPTVHARGEERGTRRQ